MARVLLYSRLMRRAELSLMASVSTDLGPRACRADDETQDSSLGCAIIDLVDGVDRPAWDEMFGIEQPTLPSDLGRACRCRPSA